MDADASQSDTNEDSSSDDALSDKSVVKIMSDDPMAAARAAAILKMVSQSMSLRLNNASIQDFSMTMI